MRLKKFLVFFSYIGTRYHGLQRLISPSEGIDRRSVQGVLDNAFNSIFRKPVKITTSSRTDTGVHALLSTVHFILDADDFAKPFSPEKFCSDINGWLEDNLEEIRLRRIVEIPLDFSAKVVESRSYIYRVGIHKVNEGAESFLVRHHPKEFPINQLYRCCFISPPFNVEIVKEACTLLLGTWNFRSFMMSSPETKEGDDFDEEHCVKTLKRVSFTKSTFEVSPYPFDRLEQEFDYYDFKFESTGFVRRQVRRMVGTLISVGTGKLHPSDITYMLENPSHSNWSNKIDVAGPEGLFLETVNYTKVPIVRGLFS